MSGNDAQAAQTSMFVFVSDEGRTVGIGREVNGEMLGACLAFLSRPVTLPEWLAALRDQPDPERAADALVARHGGQRLLHVVRLQQTLVLPFLAGGPTGEA